jgi:hypothetical protein
MIQNKYKLAFFIVLAFLIISFAFNYILWVLATNNNKLRGTYTILQIYKKVGENWVLAFEKKNDLLKYNFVNFLALVLNNLPYNQGQDNQYVTGYNFTVFFGYTYASWNDLINNVNPTSTYSCRVVIQLALPSQPYVLAYPFLYKTSSGLKVPFQIGFGNSTSQFDSGFPTLYHKTTIVSFQYKGNQCYEASHEGLSFNLNFQVQSSVDNVNKYIYMSYVGYWQNPYPSYSIVYTRLYLPLVYSTSPPSQTTTWALFWLLMAEDAVSPAVSVSQNDIVKFVYTLAINV